MTAITRTRFAVAAAIVLAGSAWAVYAQRPGGAPGAGGPPGGMPPMPVEAARVRVGPVAQEIGAVGSLLANESVIIRAEIAGRIVGIEFTEGRSVKTGDVLVRLDAAELAAQAVQHEAALELARANVERAEPMRAEKLLSPQAFDELSSKLKDAEAGLAGARERLNKATIRAPFGGKLGLRQVSPGDYVQPGQAVVNLEDVSTVKVDFRVPEARVNQVAVGQSVALRVDAIPGRAFSGAIAAMDPRLDEATRTALVRARIPNPRGELLPGMFARVAVIVGERASALLVPEQAVVPVGDEAFVFRVLDGKAARVKVVIGRRAAGEAEIVSGLGPEDLVVVGGQTKIRDGAAVTVINQDQGSPQESSGGAAPPKG
ncbi:MAG: efflux RND transporter periplasmic adaptor subunit [Nitrospirota bacterium]